MNNFFKKNKNKKIIILDVPLLLENKLNKKKYILIFVNAKKKEILRRLKKRPNFNSKIFNIVSQFQLPIEYKKKKSQYIINNNFKRSSILKSVKLLKNKILKNERSSIRHRDNRPIG